jgi:hypothetical protein
MRSAGAKSNGSLGFLTVVDDPEHGLFGGYLILNRAGRPLEFHCTAPVKPTRAQQILYGPTLEPFLYGEQIGQTLLGKARNEPAMVSTDREPVLAVREFCRVPVALVFPSDEAVAQEGGSPQEPDATDLSPARQYRCDAAHGHAGFGPVFLLGRNRLAVSVMAADDRESIVACLGELAGSFDLAEPFGRIREAIDEARRGGR